MINWNNPITAKSEETSELVGKCRLALSRLPIRTSLSSSLSHSLTHSARGEALHLSSSSVAVPRLPLYKIALSSLIIFSTAVLSIHKFFSLLERINLCELTMNLYYHEPNSPFDFTLPPPALSPRSFVSILAIAHASQLPIDPFHTLFLAPIVEAALHTIDCLCHAAQQAEFWKR